MNAWVLIIAIYSPAGDFMSKSTVDFASQSACEAVRIQQPKINDIMGTSRKGVCVTHDHWTGKKTMSGVALD
jgi:sialic acid synthase SpsE